MSNTPELLRQVVSATGEKLWVANYIWDTNLLDWVAQTPAAAGGGGAVSIADGQDTAQGAKADVAWDGVAASSTVVAILKRIATASGGGGGPATIADGADVAQGAKGDAAWDGVAASASVVALLKRVDTLLAGTLTVGGTVGVSSLPAGLATSAKQDTGNTSVGSIDGKTPALGQALAAGSVPVVMTAAQVAALTPPAAITGYALETGGNLAAIAAKDFATGAMQSTIIASLAAILASAAKESGGALEYVAAQHRLRNLLGVQQIALAQCPPNGFLPVETPSFLVGC